MTDCRKEKEGSGMSFMLQHLNNGWQVDQAILSEEDRIVLIRLVLQIIKIVFF